MENIIWKSEYNIGDFAIDSEHQKLFSIAKKGLGLQSSNNPKKDMESLKEIIKELFSYVAVHFNHEEKFMEKINYPDLDKHKILHKNLTTTLKELIDSINTMEIPEIKVKLNEYISNNLINHIISQDKKIQLFKTPLEDIRKSFGWKDIYLVDEDFIDKDHKELFDIASLAFKNVSEEEKSQKIKEVLKELYDYMKTHFKKEEEYMVEIDYPNVDEHKEIHKKIILSLNDFVKQAPSMDINILEKELARVIDITLVQHIIQEDRKITSWSSKNKK